MGKFINPFTDWGFKHIFGREASKDVLIEFLNDLLQGERVITDVQFMNSERLPEHFEYRKVIYDIYCQTDTGEHIIVEMQNRRQDHFKERGLYYLSKAIANQGVKGNWDFKLDAVYGVFFANFYLDGKEKGKFRTDVALTDMETGELFCDKLRQIYIELPRFTKEENECESLFDCWIYVLKNMEILERMPFKARKAVFDRLEQIASKANMSVEERKQYETEWKIYNDYFNTIDSSKREGREEGLAQGLAEGRVQGREEGLQEGLRDGVIKVARSMKQAGMDMQTIASLSGLPLDEIKRI